MPRTKTTAGPGNQLAVKHGARSEALIQANLPPVVQELHSALAEELPYLQPAELVLVESLARVIVRLRMLDSYYDGLGGSLIDSQGRPRRSVALYLALTRELRSTAAVLGIGPSARAALLGSLAAVNRAEAIESVQNALRARYGPQEATNDSE